MLVISSIREMKTFLLIISLISVSYAQTIGDVHFIFLGTSTSDYKNLTSPTQFSEVLNTKFYNPTKPTVIFFHGRSAKYSAPVVKVVADAYLKRGDHNMIMVDWSKFSNGSYFKAVNNLPQV